MSDQNTHDLIAAVSPVLSAVALGIYVWVRARATERAAVAAAVKVAVKVEAVKAELGDHRQAVKQRDDVTQKALAEVAEKVEEVHKATNSLTDRLVESTDKEAFMRGGAEERRRANEEDKPP